MGIRQHLLSLISGSGLMIQSNNQYPASGTSQSLKGKPELNSYFSFYFDC